MTTLFSQSWYRVADARPRLRRQAQVVRQTYRGELWYVVQDRGTGRFLRINPMAYRLIALMDGKRSLTEIWHRETTLHGDAAPTQDEVLHLLAQLHQANILISDRRPDLGEMEERRKHAGAAKLKQYFSNPLSIKLPLADPDKFITKVTQLISPVAWVIIMIIWFALMVSGLIGVIYYWDDLTHDLAAHSFTAQNMLVMAMVFPVLKGIHELGHAIAIKAFGGACREIGLMFLVFVPVPYIDASQATSFPNKYHRMLVGAADMMIELAVASIGLWIWTWIEPGVAKAVLHEVVILAGVTTLVFNANPLLRFDGYYVLADWLEIPNLGQKANKYVGYLVQRHVFSADQVLAPHLTRHENIWLVTYAVASYLYRILVAIGILLLVVGQFFFIGVLMGFWVGWNMLIQPMVKSLSFLVTATDLERVRQRAWVITLGCALLVFVGIFFVPVPFGTSTEAVVWMSDDARIRAKNPCFGHELFKKPGAQVITGDALMSCTDPELDAQISQSQGRLGELQARFSAATKEDRVQAQIVTAELNHARHRLADLVARRDAMVLMSPSDGVFVMQSPSDFSDRFLGRGDVLGYVIRPDRLTLLSVVQQGDVDIVRRNTKRVELRVVGDVWRLILGRIVREVPAATQDLPSLALSLEGGGKVGLDPLTKSEGGAKSLTPLFQFELAIPGQQLPGMLGQRVYVQFVHDAEPLAQQWFRTVRQLFLRRFSV